MILRPPLSACPVCGYSLAGLPQVHQCPECGFAYDANTIVFVARRWGPFVPAQLLLGGYLALSLLETAGSAWARGMVSTGAFLLLVGIVVYLTYRRRHRAMVVLRGGCILISDRDRREEHVRVEYSAVERCIASDAHILAPGPVKLVLKDQASRIMLPNVFDSFAERTAFTSIVGGRPPAEVLAALPVPRFAPPLDPALKRLNMISLSVMGLSLLIMWFSCMLSPITVVVPFAAFAVGLAIFL